jgi:hypothetical protein
MLYKGVREKDFSQGYFFNRGWQVVVLVVMVVVVVVVVVIRVTSNCASFNYSLFYPTCTCAVTIRIV